MLLKITTVLTEHSNAALDAFVSAGFTAREGIRPPEADGEIFIGWYDYTGDKELTLGQLNATVARIQDILKDDMSDGFSYSFVAKIDESL